MNKIALFTDSTCDLSPELLREYDVRVIPLYVTIGDVCYRDGVDLTTPEMYEKVERKEGFPKSSAPTPEDYYDAFMPFLKEGYDVIYAGISSEMSSSFQHAELAKDLLDDKYRDHVFNVDSRELSTGIGLLILKAAEWRKEGLSAEEIVAKMKNIVPRIRAQFCLDTLEYLHKGGRCSSLTHIIGATLKIHPQIKVTNGSMGVYKKTMGSFSHSVSKMVEEFNDLFAAGKVDDDIVFITNSSSPVQAAKIRAQIAPYTPRIKHLYETEAGVVISTHCGPKTIGILYIVKE